MKQRISARFYWQVRIPLISGCSFRTAGKRKIESLELTDIPKRPERMTRLSVMTEALSDSAVKVTIRDLGFGEIYKSSEKVWEYKMEL